MRLTRRQQEILDFIHRRLKRDGLPPTRAEIVENFGFRSPNAAQCHLQALADRGAIRLLAGTARGIVPVESAKQEPSTPQAMTLPIIGRVTAGTPILAVENHEDELAVDREAFSPSPDYALKVKGHSMINAGILDGDLLLVHRTPDARSGQIVVARLGDEVTVKRLRRRGRGIWLDAENPRYKSVQISADSEFSIEGLGVGVVRKRMG